MNLTDVAYITNAPDPHPMVTVTTGEFQRAEVPCGDGRGEEMSKELSQEMSKEMGQELVSRAWQTRAF